MKRTLVAPFAMALLCGLSTPASEAQEAKSVLPKYASFAESKHAFDKSVAPLFAKHCNGCHNAKISEGELDLSMLNPDMKESTSAGRWALLSKMISQREMPPEEKQSLAEADVKTIADWISAEMKRSGKHFATREAYANGNKVNHDKLFDPKFEANFDSPTTLRRLSPEIYAAEMAKAPGVGQPFTPEGKTTFRDMGAPKLDEPTTALLIRNAIQLAHNQTNFKIENGKMKAIGNLPQEFAKLLDENLPLEDAAIIAAVQKQFASVLQRQATKEELSRFTALFHKNAKDAGRVLGVRYSLAAIYLLPESIYRWELGSGPVDDQGRIRLTPREIAFAISYALTDRRPEAWLLVDADKGKLATKEGVAEAVRKMLDDPKLKKPRIMRFFQEYFGYDKCREVFQDVKVHKSHDPRILVEDTDRLVEYILEKDQNVFYELLTTNKSFVAYKTAADLKKKRAIETAKFEENKKKDPEKFKNKKLQLPGRSIYEAYNLPDFPDTQPIDLPAEERAGILTQPSWLAANSKTDENHAIFRGKWVRERLLGGVVPDVPITVDAQLPNAPHHTLRERMKVTEQEYCWKCHIYMNPVGLTFESYDFLGRYRKTEPVLDTEATAKNVNKKGKSLGPIFKDLPADAGGKINESGDPAIEGAVKNSVQMVRKIAKSGRAEQVFVRHAFRYWLCRNESLGDGPSMQQAHQVYRASGGSMKALIAALLSSDSFLYRAPSPETPKAD
ncbi:MAG: DUF1588 domain-containing protein [Gemmataceae bacterium]|nr:DUF1588 domain-containing protein [Gemmataceae bacterium]